MRSGKIVPDLTARMVAGGMRLPNRSLRDKRFRSPRTLRLGRRTCSKESDGRRIRASGAPFEGYLGDATGHAMREGPKGAPFDASMRSEVSCNDDRGSVVARPASPSLRPEATAHAQRQRVPNPERRHKTVRHAARVAGAGHGRTWVHPW